MKKIVFFLFFFFSLGISISEASFTYNGVVYPTSVSDTKVLTQFDGSVPNGYFESYLFGGNLTPLYVYQSVRYTFMVLKSDLLYSCWYSPSSGDCNIVLALFDNLDNKYHFFNASASFSIHREGNVILWKPEQYTEAFRLDLDNLDFSGPYGWYYGNNVLFSGIDYFTYNSSTITPTFEFSNNILPLFTSYGTKREYSDFPYGFSITGVETSVNGKFRVYVDDVQKMEINFSSSSLSDITYESLETFNHPGNYHVVIKFVKDSDVFTEIPFSDFIYSISFYIPPDSDCSISKVGNSLKCSGFYDSDNQHLDIGLFKSDGTRIDTQYFDYIGGTLYMPSPASPNTPFLISRDIPLNLSVGLYNWIIKDNQFNVRGNFQFEISVSSDSSLPSISSLTPPTSSTLCNSSSFGLPLSWLTYYFGNLFGANTTSSDKNCVSSSSSSINNILVGYFGFFIPFVPASPELNLDIPVPFITSSFKIDYALHTAHLKPISDPLNVSSIQRNGVGSSFLIILISVFYIFVRLLIYSMLFVFFYFYRKYIHVITSVFFPEFLSENPIPGNIATGIIALTYKLFVAGTFVGFIVYLFPVLPVLTIASHYLLTFCSLFVYSLGDYTLFQMIINTFYGSISTGIVLYISFKVASEYGHLN